MSNKQSLIPKKYVKINRAWGYGNTLFQVREERGTGTLKELRLLATDGSTALFWIYAAHTFKDKDCLSAMIESRDTARAAAQKIGRKGA